MNKRKFNDIFFGSKKNKKEEKINDDDDNISNISLSCSKKDSKIERDGNHIYFYSEVDRDTIFDLIVLIKESEEENIILSHKLNIDKIPIYLHINSFGGSIFAAFTVIDTIKLCKVPIYSIIEGSSASAATLISVVCCKKYITKSSYMLIHQLSSGCWGKFSEIEDEFKNLKELMKDIKKIYQENTKIPKKELDNLLNHDLWLNSKKCIDYGLADDIL